MVSCEMESDFYNLSHRNMSSMKIAETLKKLYPNLETIFVDQHIPLRDLTINCDERLKALLPADTTMQEDLIKFQELFTF